MRIWMLLRWSAVAGVAAVGSFLLLRSWPLAIASAGLATTMLAIAIVDAREMRIPDALSLPAIPAGLLASGHLISGYGVWIDFGHLLGMAIAGSVFWGIRESYWRLRGREGLGLGDVKLAAVAGAWTGWQGVAPVVALAAVGALAWVFTSQKLRRNEDASWQADTVIPLGVTLAPAIWLVWLAKNAGWIE